MSETFIGGPRATLGLGREYGPGSEYCQISLVADPTRSFDTGADVLEQVLRTAQFRFENKDQLWLALHDYRRGKGDFADYLVGRICAQFGCEKVLTFDRAIRDHPIFESL